MALLILALLQRIFLVASLLLLFFFFQAEDGIRDDLVTGVQTCALPISLTTRPTFFFCDGADFFGALGRQRSQRAKEIGAVTEEKSRPSGQRQMARPDLDRKSVV